MIDQLIEDVIRIRDADYADPCDAAWLRFALMGFAQAQFKQLAK